MTAIGALIGLSLSILLIIRKLSPTYSLIIGAIVGGLLGGLSLNETVTVMTEGVKEVTPAVLRILTAGVLSHINTNRSYHGHLQCDYKTKWVKTGIYGIGTRNDVALYGRRLY